MSQQTEEITDGPQCFVVHFETGPRKRPILKGKVLVWASDRAEAVSKTKKKQRWRFVGRASGLRFDAHLAHPERDRGAKRVIFPRRPAESAKSLPAQLRSSYGIFTIGCRCGYSADIDDFCKTPSGIELPRNEYQCPKCFSAWRVQAKGDGWVTSHGQFIPPGKEVLPIAPRV